MSEPFVSRRTYGGRKGCRPANTDYGPPEAEKDAEGFAVHNDANVDVFGTGRQWQRVSTGGFDMCAITMEAASSPPGDQLEGLGEAHWYVESGIVWQTCALVSSRLFLSIFVTSLSLRV